ncbi:hypothetical protein RSP822_22150, partial [Ralstonia solanacearum]|uniref:hypothetical protein n=1 Tax=Ralstonia solanacearum TaxID=305 RepID=UPI000EDF8219
IAAIPLARYPTVDAGHRLIGVLARQRLLFRAVGDAARRIILVLGNSAMPTRKITVNLLLILFDINDGA